MVIAERGIALTLEKAEKKRMPAGKAKLYGALALLPSLLSGSAALGVAGKTAHEVFHQDDKQTTATVHEPASPTLQYKAPEVKGFVYDREMLDREENDVRVKQDKVLSGAIERVKERDAAWAAMNAKYEKSAQKAAEIQAAKQVEVVQRPVNERLLDAVQQELKDTGGKYTEGSDGYTKYGAFYGKNIAKSDIFAKEAWCDMFVTWAAVKAGVDQYIGKDSYTVTHAQSLKAKGKWTETPKPGALVFFAWNGSKSLEEIKHVGIIEEVKGDQITTIEGNTDGNKDGKDGLERRKDRKRSQMVGFGYAPEKVSIKIKVKNVERPIVAPLLAVR